MGMTAHGDVTYQWVNNVLVSVSEGDLNAEGADAVGSKFQALMASNPRSEWASLAINHHSRSLLVSDAIEPLRAFISYAADQGMRHMANVNATSVQDAIADTLFKDSGVEHRVFKDLAAAVSWLQDCGYRIALHEVAAQLPSDYPDSTAQSAQQETP